MKTIRIFLSTVILFAAAINFSFAEQSIYKLTADNIIYTSERSLEFDIMIFKNVTSEDKLVYTAGQFFLQFNPKISNGGVLTFSIIKSDLPDAFRPVNPSLSGDVLRLAANMPFTENAPELNQTGMLIAKVKLETDADKFLLSEKMDLRWTSTDNIYQTMICSSDGNYIKDITNSKFHFTGIAPASNKVSLSGKVIPREFSVLQNYPNPFNPITTISFDLPLPGFVSLRVYDMSGKEVGTIVNEQLGPGRYDVPFNGSDFASGVYFYKIDAGSFSSVKRMILIK